MNTCRHERTGVSASYYTRLEQGQSLSASPEVLEALARALQLDEPDRQYLHELAGASRLGPKNRRPPTERVTEAMEHLLGNALFAGHLDFDAPRVPARRPSMARLVFLTATPASSTRTGWPRPEL